MTSIKDLQIRINNLRMYIHTILDSLHMNMHTKFDGVHVGLTTSSTKLMTLQ